MHHTTELRYAPPVTGMTAFLEPYQPWLESVLGGPLSDVITFVLDVPFGELVVEDLLDGAPLDRGCLAGAPPLRPMVDRWAIPSGVSPRVLLELSRDRQVLVTAKQLAWDPHWGETPVALWFRGLDHPVVAVEIPYVSYRRGPCDEMQTWMLVHRREIARTLSLLRPLIRESRKAVRVIGGGDLPLPEGGYDWSTVVLEPALIRLLRDDFEGFLQREPWFRRHRLPFRRGYFLYGPPGNGKTSIIRVMASHPLITSYTLNFSNEELNNGDLTFLFESAGRRAPSLVIFEDLDRLYGTGRNRDNLTKITLQHLLNCLDGLASHDGVVVVATANDPTVLDAAILRRPGRFDRAVACRPPSEGLRREYLRRLAVDPLPDDVLTQISTHTEDFSYAQVREAYILGGQLAFQRGADEINGADLLEACRLVRVEGQTVGHRVDGRGVGFALSAGLAVAPAPGAPGRPASEYGTLCPGG